MVSVYPKCVHTYGCICSWVYTEEQSLVSQMLIELLAGDSRLGHVQDSNHMAQHATADTLST